MPLTQAAPACAHSTFHDARMPMAVPAVLWESAIDAKIRCILCAHYCRIPEGESGRCRVRFNQGGRLYSLASDNIVSANPDPVEKKPLFHFLPGSIAFSVGTPGCNMTCSFCQNHSLSQGPPPLRTPLEPLPDEYAGRVVRAALDAGAKSIAYTYNEPTVAVELVRAAAARALNAGLANILISNGYQSPECMEMLQSLIQAANFDLKSFRDDFYTTYCGARLKPVLRTLEQAVAYGWWIEITTLLIPGRNDSDKELRDIARFIKENLGKQVPWHISRFHPAFRMRDAPVTPLADLERAHAVGRAEGLLFVYAGNVPGHASESTFCPSCEALFIRRAGYRCEPPASGRCAACGTSVPGVWGFPAAG